MSSKSSTSGLRVVNALQNALVPVWATVVPESVDAIRAAVLRSNGRLSVSGERYSPDTQFALAGALHLDLSQFNQVVAFWPVDSRIRVQAGMRWAELLKFVQPHGFALEVPPQYCNGSVGGSVAVNGHGQGINTGPIGNSVTALRVVLVDGSDVEVTPDSDPDLFRALIGSFGGIGIIVEVELKLAANRPLLRKAARLSTQDYIEHVRSRVAGDPGAVLHSAEFYTQRMRHVHATTWVACDLRTTNDQSLRSSALNDPLIRVFGGRGRNPLTRWWREHIIDPLRDSRRTVHWRNYEATADIAQAFPRVHEVPPHECLDFVIAPERALPWLERLRAVLREFDVRARGLSVTQLAACPNSFLALSDGDALLFRLIVRSASIESPRSDQSTWVRALIDATLDCEGRFSLAHRMYATVDQFRRAYPDVESLLQVRRRVDPSGRLGNGFWERYVDAPQCGPDGQGAASELRTVLSDLNARDVIHRIVHASAPAGRGAQLFSLLQRVVARTPEDELVYSNLLRALRKWRSAPFASLRGPGGDWRTTLQRNLSRSIRSRLALLPRFDGRTVEGVIDVQDSGGQMSLLRRHLRIGGHVGYIDGFGIPGAAQRGAARRGAAVPARAVASDDDGNDWSSRRIGVPDESISLILLLAGLHGLSDPAITGVVTQCQRALRPGGLVVLLEHDAHSAPAALEASVAVMLGHLCAGQSWEMLKEHPRNFRAADEWVAQFAQAGLRECGERDSVARTPAGDTLMTFRKPA